MGWPLYGIGVREYVYACPLPPASVNATAWPTSLSVTTATAASSPDRRPAMPVERARRPGVQRPLAVCVQAAFRRLDAVRLVEWLEFQRLLGKAKGRLCAVPV